ncbi:hypothetical protein G1K67_11940, partial [Tenacibaculum finnmarkense]|nr:hypothetical protein [Tenacibaculum finnmarkense genomovar finnmarkense]MCG8732141.1 hypothetical protein [Tenacibaculum finnmarkense]MBE7696135.1 hypothetical protein [Tenacibaculum finnmarkense genomovar finnmarkense]MCD8428369.1 hypothetical protein [Tenacibaculum finnmarkense genomovar finnmarkense]MCG8752703.1 hypothetical protein [Tenacibaculum finnmarkense]
MLKTHSFHIPVMGIGFIIDSPLKVSRFGIDSVISLVDDILLEKIRKMYSLKFKIPYDEITEKMDDFRAERVTSYLNLMKTLSEEKFEEFKKNITQTKQDIVDFFEDLPDSSSLKQEFVKVTSSNFDVKKVTDWLKENLSMGQIDVNIMTKVDKDNYTKSLFKFYSIKVLWRIIWLYFRKIPLIIHSFDRAFYRYQTKKK